MVLLLSNCRKELSAGKLGFSTDTLTFDTVFTSIGSTTQYFKVYNSGRTSITISKIQLLHLEGNQFTINVDAVNGSTFTNVVVPARDSIYVFVQVTVNPNSTATPFVIMDEVQFNYNSNVQKVVLQAWGQNAHFHYNEELGANNHDTTVTWLNDLPHVIIGGEQVDCGSSLTISPGCHVYMGGAAAMYIFGSLTATASKWSDSIVFRGYRLEPYYDQLPGQWFGIVFLRDSTGGPCSGVGQFNHCIIDESSYGIYSGAGISTNLATYAGAPQCIVNINHTIVSNSQYNAVYGFNTIINAVNSLFYVGGGNLVELGLGGNYSFNFCTIYNIGSPFISHQMQTLLLSNFVSSNNVTYPAQLNASFSNCVIYGNLMNEISFNNYSNSPTAQFNSAFTDCCLKTSSDTLAMYSLIDLNNLVNTDPGFEAPASGNFTPADSAGFTSPIIDYDNLVVFQDHNDLYDNPRPVTLIHPNTPYDIGAVERQTGPH